MDKKLRFAANFLIAGVLAYAGLFVLWLLLVGGCLDHAERFGRDIRECGQNDLTRVVRVAYGWIL